jgi:hypothetical protein
MKLYCGIDLHSTNHYLTLIDEEDRGGSGSWDRLLIEITGSVRSGWSLDPLSVFDSRQFSSL